MRIGIYTNTKRDLKGETSLKFIEMLQSSGVEVVVCDVLNDIYDKETVSLECMVQCVDIVVVFGGDGTVLNVARLASLYAKPVLGINNGYLGFLTEVDNTDLEKALNALLEKQYTIENRSMLEVVCEGHTHYAINEMSLARWNMQQTIQVQYEVDDKFADLIVGDGVIVCTPTGSTAYSLSCGGAILSPSVKAFEITAISPHSLHNRPIVISEDSVITIKGFSEKGSKLALMVDGTIITIKAEEISATVKKAKYEALFVRFDNKNFYPKLVEKLGYWNKTKLMEK